MPCAEQRVRLLGVFIVNLLRGIVIFASLCGATLAEPAIAQQPAVAQCEALQSEDFSTVQDAPTAIVSARFVSSARGVPPHCEVQGYVAQHVGIALLLPASGWNGKFVEVGCGGFCGVLLNADGGTKGADCDDALRKGFACIGSNQGHSGTPDDALWAYNNPQSKIDYGIRAAHVAALAGKAVTTRYYGRQPRISYFFGCSGGGRQALVEAQLFPGDFDGIFAGAPALQTPKVMMRLLWQARVATDRQNSPLFTPADSRRIHDAVVAQCDLNDGVTDGLIGNPRACGFKPASLACRAGESGDCMSRAQVEAMEALLTGPRTSRGETTYVGDVPGLAVPDSFWWLPFPQDFFRYLGFDPAPGPRWQFRDFDFDRDHERLGMSEALTPGDNPDLRGFKAAGGKLIMAHGWADATITPMSTVDYFETVEKTMGGAAATGEFLRLYMIPGMDHCTGGDGAYAIDFLAYLDDWVDKGRTPERIVGVHIKNERAAGWSQELPVGAADVAFTRPFFPYPTETKYRGNGDPNDAASFGPDKP